jgi:hypothetical protein
MSELGQSRPIDMTATRAQCPLHPPKAAIAQVANLTIAPCIPACDGANTRWWFNLGCTFHAGAIVWGVLSLAAFVVEIIGVHLHTGLAAFHHQLFPCFEAEDSTAGDLPHCGISKEPLSALGQERTSSVT